MVLAASVILGGVGASGLWVPDGIAVGDARAEPPSISDPIRLDHGYRYDYEVVAAQTASIALSDSAVLMAWGEDGGAQVMGRLYGPAGETVGDSTVVPIGVGCHFDLSEPDASGWKMAAQDGRFGYGSEAISVRNLDRRTLEIIGERTLAPPNGLPVYGVTMARFGDLHVVVWVESDYPIFRLRLARVDGDLQPLELQPLLLPPLPARWNIDLASGPSGGMLAFIDGATRASVLPLGPDGLPAGAPIPLGPVSGWEVMVSIRPCPSGWVAAWGGLDGLRFAFLDPTGSIVPPGVFSIDAGVAAGLTSVAGPDGTGLLCWRQGFCGFEGIHTVRIAPGLGPIGDPALLDAGSPYEQHSDIQDPRGLAAVWTGSRYAVLWVSFRSTGDQLRRPEERPRSAGDQRRLAVVPVDGRDRRQRSPYGSFPARVSYLDASGVLIEPSPQVASRGSIPEQIALLAAPSGNLAVVRERKVDEYLHVFRLDPEGRPLGSPERHASFAPPDSCGPEVCFYCEVRDLAARPWSGGMSAGYPYRSYRWSYGEIHDQEWRIVVDRIDARGGLAGRAAFEPGNGVWDYLIDHDFAMVGDSALVLCATDDGAQPLNPDRGWVHLVGPDGAVLRTWELATNGRLNSTAMTPLANGRSFLLLWADDHVPFSAVLDLDAPGSVVTGQPFLMGLGELRTRARLLAGPGQFCALLPLRIAGRWDVYAARFDASGMPLAAGPSPVFAAAGDQWDPDGVWDGNQYLVTCTSFDGGPTMLLGNRLGTNGEVYDGDGFPIDALVRPGAAVSTAGGGRCLVGYDGNRLRTIDDPGPLARVEGGGSARHALSSPRALRLAPNPSRGTVYLAERLPWSSPTCRLRVFDAAGHEIATRRSVDADGPSGRIVVWDGRTGDGRLAPSGVYHLRIEGEGGAGSGKVLVLR